MSRNMSIEAIRDLVKSKTEDTFVKFEKFSYGTRVLLLLLREKDGGGSTDFKRRSLVKVTHEPSQFRKALEQMLTISYFSEQPYRVYVTVNDRNIKKAEKYLKEQMLEHDFAPDVNKAVFYERFESRWHSALMKDTSRSTSFFLLDIDDDEFKWNDIEQKCWDEDIQIVFKTRTKNGWHFITEPFNPDLLGEYKSCIQKDSQILMHW